MNRLYNTGVLEIRNVERSRGRWRGAAFKHTTPHVAHLQCDEDRSPQRAAERLNQVRHLAACDICRLFIQSVRQFVC
jgi:hypothetical protein